MRKPKFQKVKKETVENIKDKFEEFRKEFGYSIRNLENADNMKEFIDIKRELLLSWLNIPLGAQHCIYCIHQEAKHETYWGSGVCNGCTYGKKHGECPNENSTYRKIFNALTLLINEIEHY